MAERDPRAEGSEEEEEEEQLPTLASLMQCSPAPLPPALLTGPGRRPPSPPVAELGRAAEVLVVDSSESEGEREAVELGLLPQGIEGTAGAQGEAAPEPPRPGGRDAAAGAGPCRGLLAPGSRGPRGPPPLSPGEGSCGGQKDTMPASQPDSTDQPRSLPGSRASPGTSSRAQQAKYSRKEREAMRQAARQRREEREAKRRQQEQEKEHKRALAKRLKAQRPGECQKYITVVVDSVLLQVEGGREILSALQAANYSCVVESQAVPCSITWRRRTVSSQMEEGEEWTEEPHVLVVLRSEEFLSMVHNYKQEAQGSTEGEKRTLQSYVAHVMAEMPGKIPALVVAEVENYFRFQSKRPQEAAASANQEEKRGKRRKKRVEDSGLEITRMDMEEALVDLQLSTKVQVTSFESWEELGGFATAFTKAVAEAPFKREKQKVEFPFYLEKRWCGGVKVEPSGKGLLEVWKRQIQQFNRVSSEMAEAIVSAYPSPQLLVQAYRRCSSEQEQKLLLADIPVHRGEGVTATTRRIGPDLSRRIYLQMTSHDPDLYLDVTG